MRQSELSQEGQELTKSELIARLRPGAWSDDGFLGTDESFDEVFARDAETVARLGISYDELADALALLFKKELEEFEKQKPDKQEPMTAEEFEKRDAHKQELMNLYQPQNTFQMINLMKAHGMLSGIMVDHFEVVSVMACGFQECPWGCRSAWGDSDYLIINCQTGESVTTSQLHPHLIRAHLFFEGFGTPYRTDPEQLARVLELVKS